jgi:hypothetical protein
MEIPSRDDKPRVPDSLRLTKLVSEALELPKELVEDRNSSGLERTDETEQKCNSERFLVSNRPGQ